LGVAGGGMGDAGPYKPEMKRNPSRHVQGQVKNNFSSRGNLQPESRGLDDLGPFAAEINLISFD
jgi:hypothetical protein